MGKKGRPATKPSGMREGFYLELQTKGSGTTVKIRRENMAEIKAAIKQFEQSKVVTYLGQVKDGRWIDGKNKGKKAS